MTCEHAAAMAIGNSYDEDSSILWCQSCGAVARADGNALEMKDVVFMRPDAWLKASASQVQRDLAEARRELEETRRIWHEKQEGLQAFADTLATQLSGAVAEATRAKDESGRLRDLLSETTIKLGLRALEGDDLLAACEAVEHWYSVDSSEFNRETAMAAVRAAIAMARRPR